MINYKNVIKSRNLRMKILSLLNWVPDKLMIKIQYYVKTGRKLNLTTPVRYTEKLQWYKLNYRNPLMPLCADKYTVQDYVTKKGFGDILNGVLGVYDNPIDINFNKLPNKFVIKKTNGGGGNDVLICKDKSTLDIDSTLEKIQHWTKVEKNGGGREWLYYKVKPRIIIEKFIESNNNDLIDYKFFCFNGVPKYLYIINGRTLGGKVKLGIFDLNYNQLNYFRADENKMDNPPPKPENFNEMINIAKKLSEDFPHVRVDLYNIEGKIIFGELTFFDGSGYQTYKPDEFDLILGKEFKLIQYEE